MQCEFNPFLRMIDNYHLCLFLVAFGLALTFRNKKWAVLTGITSFYYYIGFVTVCDVVTLDTEKTWRYVIWVVWDVLWMLTIYIAWHRKLVNQYQAAGAIVLGFCGDLLQVVRFIDRHYFELTYTTPIYTTIAPALNNLLVLICLYPLVSYFKIGISKWQSR